jgi:hypothetical protein
MTDSTNTIRVVIPLTIRKRNGRPKILPPDEVTLRDGRSQGPHVLRAIARAWSWCQRRSNFPHFRPLKFPHSAGGVISPRLSRRLHSSAGDRDVVEARRAAG